MIFYQVRDKRTGLWYKRGPDQVKWVAQEMASVWTTPSGPQGCLQIIARYNRRRAHPDYRRVPEVIPLQVKDPPTVTFVDGDDWQGLYLNGKLVEEGHCVRVDDILRRLGIACEQIYADDQWLAKRGSLPENRNDIKEG